MDLTRAINSQARPATRDDVFFYDTSGFHVRQNGQRYRRVHAIELYELVAWVDKGPILTKKGVPRKRQPPPHKDESEAYYSAQALHYGLQPLDSKDATKKALLEAFNGRRNIPVPDRISALENELRELWHAERERVRPRCEQELKEREEAEKKRRLEDRRRHEIILDEYEASAAPATQASSSQKRKAADDGDATQKKAKTGDRDSGKVRCKHYRQTLQSSPHVTAF